MRKIDRVMGNIEFLQEWPDSMAVFQPYRISDHTPAVLRLSSNKATVTRPFKFFNLLVHKTEFL